MNVLELPNQNIGNRIGQGELVTLAQRKKICNMCKYKGIKCEKCENGNVESLLNGLDPYQKQQAEYIAHPFVSPTPVLDFLDDALMYVLAIPLGIAGFVLAGFILWGFGWIIWRIIQGVIG